MAICLPTTRIRDLSTCFRLIFIFWVSLSFYDVYDKQSEIFSPPKLKIPGESGGGGGRGGGEDTEEHISSLSQTKKSQYLKRKKIELSSTATALIFDYCIDGKVIIL